jgi:hypothetical protein
MSTLTTGIGGFNPAAGTNTGSNQVFGNPPKVYTVDQAKIRIAGGDDIRRMVIEDTAENITKGFDDLKGWAGDKILKGIKVTDNAEVSLKVADLNGTSSEVTTVLKRLEKATVKVEDIASEIEGGLDDLKLYQRRLDGMAVVGDQDGDASTTDDREAPLLSLTAAEFKSARKVLGKLEGALIEVELSGNFNQYQIKAGKNGAISAAKGLEKFSGEAHFLKFADQRVVASSGDSRIDALLEVGKLNMWSPSADTANKLNVKSSVENAADADWQQIMPGVFSLDETLDATDPIALTYGFHPNGTNVPAGDKKFFAPLDEAQKAVVRDAFSYLGGLMNIKFAEENLDAAKTSFQFGTNEQASSAAYAYMPIATTAAPSQIMLANNQASNDFASFLTGDDDSDTTNGYQIKTSDLINLRKSYGWSTVVHEIGHALGLKHPGDYNAGGGGASPPYLPKILDSKLWSVMSYNSIPTAFSTDPTNTSGSRQTPQTMMAYDIAALQFLYGKANSSESAQTSVVSAISDNVIAGDKVKLTIDSTDYEYTVVRVIQVPMW